jgi:hypothetical protein
MLRSTGVRELWDLLVRCTTPMQQYHDGKTLTVRPAPVVSRHNVPKERSSWLLQSLIVDLQNVGAGA